MDCTAVYCVRKCADVLEWCIGTRSGGGGVQDIQERVRRRVNLGIGSSFDGFNVVRKTGRQLDWRCVLSPRGGGWRVSSSALVRVGVTQSGPVFGHKSVGGR